MNNFQSQLTFGAISLYTSGNIDVATYLYLIVHRMAAELPIKYSTYTLLLLIVVVFVYRESSCATGYE